MWSSKEVDLSELLGETLVAVTGATTGSGGVDFETASGKKYTMYHEQDCCESVQLEDVTGDVNDLLGSPLTMSEEVSNADFPQPRGEYVESYTWTFYKFATVKGYVTLRWLGESNGYYGESVSVYRV